MTKPVKFDPARSWALAVIVLAVAYASSMVYFARGKWVLPLDDAYISLTYARNLLAGYPFRFNLSDPMSTGATSILYTWLLVPLCALLKGEKTLVIGIFALNAVLLWIACRTTYSLARLCIQPRMAQACVFGILLSGPITWGYFCGLDTGLMVTLTLVFWYVWRKSIDEGAQYGWVPLVAISSLLGLCRPEGAFLAPFWA